ncbi:MAG: NAD(P)-binding protein [Candidatus Thermoplasmatota archaeon]|nr:NAD(P)-binding protein [Candidatus Thermoplasmatota archaeon]|tara:strand:- start:950 stop:2029 length:1080 start_codon:yes stop_codon:yes gene_type:complete
MRRVGIVGDGLAGLIAARSAAQSGAEVLIFARSEPIGGLAAPVHADAEWLFDRIPLNWNRTSYLATLLKSMGVGIHSRRMIHTRMAFILDEKRYTLPGNKGLFWKSNRNDALEADWLSVVKATKAKDLSNLEGAAKHMATLLSVLWSFNTTPNLEALEHHTVRNFGRIPTDGWAGVSGRLIAACSQWDVTFHTEGPVLGFRRDKNGNVDGIKRKGRIMPVDAVIQAHNRSDSTIYGRYIGTYGNFMLPHVALWDVDREVLLVDLGRFVTDRIPKEHRNKVTMFHCFAFGDQNDAAERVEAVLDSQCSGWRKGIIQDFQIEDLRLPIIPEHEYEDGIYYAHVENAELIGKMAANSLLPEG